MIPVQQLSARSKLLLATEILFAYARVRSAMRRAELPDVIRSIRSRPAVRPIRSESGSPQTLLVAGRLAGAVSRTLRVLPTDSRCLVQSLVLSRLLCARAISSTLVIGAQPKPDFAAHAWVEHAGRPVLSPGTFYASRLIEL